MEMVLKIKRYEIYIADLNPTIGSEIKKTRPVVIISQDLMNKNLETIVICPLTSRLHPKWRSRIQIKCAGKESEIAIDQIRTISKQRLKKKIDKLKPEKILELKQTIFEMYAE
jgi:mRNA interferase MazF